MKKTAFTLLAPLAATLLFSCGGGGRRAAAYTGADTIYRPRYATGFVVERVPGGKLIRITDPWQGADGYVQEVFLAGEGATAPGGFAGTVLRTPLEKVVCMSSTYIAYIDELGRTEAVAGVSGAKYVSNGKVREGYAAGRVRDVGYDTGLNYEMLAAFSPDVVLAYGITGENSVLSGKLAQLGIPLVYIGDYVEQSPLGKAEWLVAFGYLFDREEKALEVFDGIDRRYNAIKSRVASNIRGSWHEEDRQPADPEGFGAGGPVTGAQGDLLPGGQAGGMPRAPVVMLNAPYRDTWFVPGDRSYMVRLIEDAGGVYACAGEDSEASRPISLETAYIKMLSSTLWLNPGQAKTLPEVKAENPRLAATPPVASGRVYNCNKRSTPEGGSDFWESGAVRCDRVLEDLVKIFYPETFADGELYYFQKLE